MRQNFDNYYQDNVYISVSYHVESYEIVIFVGQKWVNIDSFILFSLIVIFQLLCKFEIFIKTSPASPFTCKCYDFSPFTCKCYDVYLINVLNSISSLCYHDHLSWVKASLMQRSWLTPRKWVQPRG